MQRRVLTGALATSTLVISLPAIVQTAPVDWMSGTWSARPLRALH